LKNRAGPAHPQGVKHRLDPQTLRISEWGSLRAFPPYMRQEAFAS
jgi:hypothetical protein